MNDTPINKIEVGVSTEDGHCPHSSTMQCPSPKKGLAHAIVQCNIHLGRILDPRILPCGHSFCFRCLKILYEQQQQCPANRRSSSSANKLTCPLCRRENKIESLEKLTLNYALCDLLEIFDAEEKEEERIRREAMAEMEHTAKILRCIQKRCYNRIATENVDPNGVRDAMIATEKRIQYLEDLVREIEHERDYEAKERMIRRLSYTCLAYQRLAEMLEGEMEARKASGKEQDRRGKEQESREKEQEKRNKAQKTVSSAQRRGHNSLYQMYKDTVTLEYRPTESMTDRRARIWFSLIFSLIGTWWKELVNDRFCNAASIISLEFSKNFDECGWVWIVVTGRRPLGCWIWKDENDYACLDLNNYRIVVYRRTLQIQPMNRVAIDKTSLGLSTLDLIMHEAVKSKEGAGRQDLNVARFIRERLQTDFDGRFWHVTAGYKDVFSVCASTKGELVDLDVITSQEGMWKAMVWEG